MRQDWPSDTVPAPKPGTPFHDLSGEQLEVIGQDAVRKLIADGVIEPEREASRPRIEEVAATEAGR